MNLQKKWTVYLIHHSHLDVGYTHTTSEISARYIRFLDDILLEIELIKSGKEETKGYKYTVECYWILDNYFKSASNDKIAKMKKAIEEGYIEVTGSYFNFTDSIHPRIYGSLVKRAQKLAQDANSSAKAAMFSDVNGLNVTYAMELANNGIEYLFTNVHSGHGIFALNEKLIPFNWKLPNNKEILTYNGELYTYGNEFGFCPRGAFSDVIDDEGYDAKSYNYDDKINDWIDLPKKRFNKLLGYLENNNHKFNFVAMGIHGTDDDNAIPNPGIVPRIKQWNELYSDEVEVKLVTLTEFFDEIKDNENIETYEGDWADWWSDGIGTAPYHFKYFKKLQTEYLYYKDVASELTKDVDEEIETTIALYAEHTFGHFMSISDPHLLDAGMIQLVKEGYIGRLVQLVNDIKYKYYNANGANNYSVNVSNRFLLVNPTSEVFKSVVTLKFDKFDLYTYPAPYKITDSKGRVYPYFMKGIKELRTSVPHIYIELDPSEQIEITVDKFETNEFEIQLFEEAFHTSAAVGFERLTDINPLSIPKSEFLFERVMMSEDQAQYKDVLIKWNESGIFSIFDKTINCELLNGKEYLGAPIFEIVKESKAQVWDDREANRRYRFISRNKKTLMSNRYFGKLDYVDLIEDNPYYFEIALYFKINKFDLYKQTLRIYKTSKKIEMNITLTKEYVKQSHNLYISLPFTTKQNKVFVDRGDILLEAWKDHLPGTLTEHNSVYGGFFIERDDLNIQVSCPDVFLLQLKSYKYEPTVLMCENIKDIHDFNIYSWPICNMWHVNFFARESNHLNLNYTIEWGTQINKSSSLEKFRQSSLGVIQYKV